jgi:hypothetical protein
MATLTITIPDDQLTRVVTALCTLQGVAVSPANAKQVLIAHIKQIVYGFENDANTRTAIAGLPALPDPGMT